MVLKKKRAENRVKSSDTQGSKIQNSRKPYGAELRKRAKHERVKLSRPKLPEYQWNLLNWLAVKTETSSSLPELWPAFTHKNVSVLEQDECEA